MLELRGHGTLTAAGNKTLTGYAAVFNSEANLGTFSEVIRPGAFDVAGCSFGFRVAPGGDRWEERGPTMVRELLAVELAEITLTSDPAYQDTTVAMRSKPVERSFWDLNQAWMQTV